MARRRRRKAKRTRSVRDFLAKIGTLNIVLVLVGAFFLWFNWQMLNIYRECMSIPETYACAVITATIGECGICGWIKTNKDRRQDREWQKEDKEETERLTESEAEKNE